MTIKQLVSAFSRSLALLATALGPAHAGVFVWNGSGGDNNWSTDANWAGGAAPPASQTDTVVEFDGMLRLTNSQNIANKMSLNGIIFDKNAGTGLVSFNLSGMPVSLGADAGNDPKITNNTTRSPTNTISMDMEFANPTTINGNGSARLVLSGGLAGISGVTLDSSTFPLLLSGSRANGYGGTTTINAGTISLNKSANGVTAIPNDLVIGNGNATAAVTMMGFSQQIATRSNVTVNTNGTLTLSSTGLAAGRALSEQIATLSGSGNVDLGTGSGGGGPGRNILLTGGKGKDAPFSGVISGNGNFTKNGSNTLVLTGQNTYTGKTTVGRDSANNVVDGGVLTVDGGIGTKQAPTGFVEVAKGTLNGTGTIFSTGLKGVTIGPDGKIKPGRSPGVLTIGSGGFDMQSGSVFDEEIDRGPGGPIACNGAGCYSQLDVVDGTTLEDSTLSVILDSAPVVGDLFAIINNLDTIPVTGTFAGLGEDGTFTADFDGVAYLFEISYDGNAISPSQVTFDGGNDVVLQVIGASPIPEPSSLAGLLVGVIALGGLRRIGRLAHRTQ